MLKQILLRQRVDDTFNITFNDRNMYLNITFKDNDIYLNITFNDNLTTLI